MRVSVCACVCVCARAQQKWRSLIRQRADSTDELPSLLHNLRLAFPPESTFTGGSALTERGNGGGGMETIHLHYLFSLWFLQSHSLHLLLHQPPPSSPSLLMFLFCSPHPFPPPVPPPSPHPSLEGNAAFPHVVLLLKQRRNEIMPSEGGSGGGCSQGSFYSASVRTFL